MNSLTELYRARLNRRYYEFIANIDQQRQPRRLTDAGVFWIVYLLGFVLALLVVLL